MVRAHEIWDLIWVWLVWSISLVALLKSLYCKINDCAYDTLIETDREREIKVEIETYRKIRLPETSLLHCCWNSTIFMDLLERNFTCNCCGIDGNFYLQFWHFTLIVSQTPKFLYIANVILYWSISVK